MDIGEEESGGAMPVAEFKARGELNIEGLTGKGQDHLPIDPAIGAIAPMFGELPQKGTLIGNVHRQDSFPRGRVIAGQVGLCMEKHSIQEILIRHTRGGVEKKKGVTVVISF